MKAGVSWWECTRGVRRTLWRATLALGIVLLAAELTLRAMGYGNYERYLPDPNLLWVLEPGQRSITHFGHKPVKVNSEGMRGDEFSLEKPAGKVRIVCFGDSTTYGYGVGQRDTYPAQLHELLEKNFPGKYEVLNAGVNGYGTYQELVALRRALRYHPDVVVISSTYNDDLFMKSLRLDGGIVMAENETRRIHRGVWMKRMARRVALYNFGMEKMAKRVYRQVKDQLITGTWSTDYPPDGEISKYRPILLEIVQTARSRGIEVVFLIPHMGGLGPYGEIMVQTAERLNIPYVYMGQAFERYRPEEVFYLDHGHPTEFGHRLIALELFKLLTAGTPTRGEGKGDQRE